MTEPFVLTDELRRAVKLEQCATEGHVFSLSNLFSDGGLAGSITVRANDGELLPHVFCARCGQTWMVLPDPGNSYDDAEMRLRDRLYKADPINKRPERTRLDRPVAK